MTCGGHADFRIMNPAGQTMRTASGDAISVAGLPAGIYIVVANTSDRGVLVSKIHMD